MAAQLSVAARNARADAVTTTVGSAGKLRIYTGAAPATCGDAATGTLLSEHTTGTPFAAGAAAGVLSPTLPANVNAGNSGTAGYWRQYKSDGTTCVAQGTCGTAATDMILNTTALVSGGPVAITAWSFTEGAA